MPRFAQIVLLITILSGFLLTGGPALAQRPQYTFKVASLAPSGSVWAKRFNDFAAEVKEQSGGRIGFKVYAGGVMGDDRAMYRKMRVGQLHGAGFTMTGISEIVPDFRVLGIPFLLQSYAEVDHVKKELWPRLKKEFSAKDMELLALSEVGFIYTMSKTPITTLAELKTSKAWAPEGDPISMALLETVGVTPIPLAIPDVLTALQTGMINTAFNSFYGAIVLQWFTRVNYISDIPFAYAYGAFVLDQKTFAKLPPDLAAMMEALADKHFARLLTDTRQSNEEALKVLKDNGITLVKPTPVTRSELYSYREITTNKLIDTAFSRSIYDETTRYLQQFRAALNVAE